eukprot:scaffold10301_cov115-Skeletonema_dohrnii-CCMP3373.AAC.7
MDDVVSSSLTHGFSIIHLFLGLYTSIALANSRRYHCEPLEGSSDLKVRVRFLTKMCSSCSNTTTVVPQGRLAATGASSMLHACVLKLRRLYDGVGLLHHRPQRHHEERAKSKISDYFSGGLMDSCMQQRDPKPSVSKKAMRTLKFREHPKKNSAITAIKQEQEARCHQMRSFVDTKPPILS